MSAIFISYRREDAEGQAGRLFDDLAMHFGEGSVFMDVVGIEPGRDFRLAIDEHVASCGVLLAVIGKIWLDAKDESGRLRLEDSMDFVRLEIASALKRGIPVIPVLVRGASIPRPDQLPPDLADLAFRNGVELTHARWDSDVQILIKALRPHVVLLQKDAGSVGTEPVARVLDKGGIIRPSDESKVDSTAPGATTLSAKKSLRRIVTTSVAAIAVGIGSYIWYEQAADDGRKAGKNDPPPLQASQPCFKRPGYPMGKWLVTATTNNALHREITFTTPNGGIWTPSSGQGNFEASNRPSPSSEIILTLRQLPGTYTATETLVVSADGCEMKGTINDAAGLNAHLVYEWRVKE
jgi:hypothetical protein